MPLKNPAFLPDFFTMWKVEFLGIFGSAARGESRPDSDVDLLIRFSPQAKVGYFKLFDIEQSLVSNFGKKVDLVTQDALSPYIKDRVYSDLQTIYGQP
jgi:predicted nucleotidyltransferase